MTDNQRILQINKLYHPWLGGVESHVKQLAENLSEQNQKVKVLCCNTRFKTQSETINKIPVLKISSLGIYFSMPVSFSFFYYLKKEKADILHFHLPNPLAVFSYLIMKPKGKLFVTWHSDIIKQKLILFFIKPFIYKFLSKAKKIIVASPNMFENSLSLKKYKNKIEVIPYSINPQKYQLSQKIKQKTSRFILFIGRLIYYKGLNILLEALRDTNIQLIIIGEGPLKEDLQKYIKNNFPNNQVTIRAPLPFQDLLTYLHTCEFLVLPSIQNSEAFGIVQLEAMACKKPVISTNLPTGVPYVNKNNTTGLIVEPGNVNALKKAIIRLYSDQKLCDKLGKQAYERVLAEFKEEDMIKKILNLYYT